MILFGNRVFTDVIKTRIKKDHPGLGMVLNPISMSSEEDGKGDLTHTKEAMGRQRQILEGCSHKPRNTQSWKRKEGSSLELQRALMLVCMLPCAQLFPTLCDLMNCITPGFPILHQLQSLLKLMSIKSVIPSNHFILCHPLLLPPSTFPSIRIFSNESVL